MKRLLFAAASLTMFAACSDTDDVLQNDKVTDEGRLVTVTTTLPGETPDSRVTLTEENADTDSRRIKVEWKESGETFSVMTATSTATQTFTQTEGSNEFTGTLTEDWTQPYYAFYPATSATNATAVPYDLSTQTGTLDEATNYMYAVNTTDGKEYNFQHLNAIVKFTLNLPTGYTPDSLSLVSDRLLAKGTVDLTGDAVAYTNELSAHSITVKNPTVTDGKITLYLHVSPMAASAESKNTLHIRTYGKMNGSYNGYSGSISTSKEIKAGKYYTATVDVTTHDYYRDSNNYTVYSPWGLRAWGEGKANTTQYKTVVYGCKLMNDMDMSTLPNDIEIEGHAGNWKTTKPMISSKTFDGANKTISNLRIIGGYFPGANAWNYVGFIGQANNTVIKDVIFKGATVVNNLSRNSYIGIVLGYSSKETTISGVTIEPNPDSTEPVFRIFNDATGLYIGSLVGRTGSNIKNCINNQDLTIGGINGSTPACNSLDIGGIAGQVAGTSCSFIQCVNNGDIDVRNVTINVNFTTPNRIAGGIVAQMGKAQFVACANTGSITATDTKYKIYGIGYDATTNANYGCYTLNHAAATINADNPATLVGFYDSVSTDVTGVTQVTDFNTDEVVNGMNAALVTYNSTADLADAKKCDKHWAISTDADYPYPVLVDGAPTASETSTEEQ